MDLLSFNILNDEEKRQATVSDTYYNQLLRENQSKAALDHLLIGIELPDGKSSD